MITSYNISDVDKGTNEVEIRHYHIIRYSRYHGVYIIVRVESEIDLTAYQLKYMK